MVKKFNICILGDHEVKVFIELAKLFHFSFLDLGFRSQISKNLVIREKGTVNIIIGIHLLSIDSLKGIPNSKTEILEKDKKKRASGKIIIRYEKIKDLFYKLKLRLNKGDKEKKYDYFPKETIIFNTEQLEGLSELSDHRKYWSERISEFGKRFEMWDYSRRNIETLNKMGVNNIKLVEIGFQKELATINHSMKKDVDVLFYGIINERRKKILDDLEKKDIKVKVLDSVWGKERDMWISRSRIVLNMHYYDAKIFEVARCFYLMTNSVAIVSEVSDDTYIDSKYRDGIIGVTYEKLVNKCYEILKDEEELKMLREQAFRTISSYPQSEIMRKIIEKQN